MLPPLSRMGPNSSPPPSPLDYDYSKQWSITLLSWATGVVIFPVSLGIFQVILFRPVQLTCASFGATFLGAGAVATAGIAASVGLMGTSGYLLKFGNGKVFLFTLNFVHYKLAKIMRLIFIHAQKKYSVCVSVTNAHSNKLFCRRINLVLNKV